MRDKTKEELQKGRATIAATVRTLRRARDWTQADLSRRLGLSQSRLSEIEGGAGSFTAEQFLAILRLFNASVNDFVHPPRGGADAQLQNALARFGALHLHESEDVVADERATLHRVVRDTLLSGSPRLIAALGPVVVRHADDLGFAALAIELAAAGLHRRVFWLVENVLEAVRQELTNGAPREWARVYRRAEVVLEAFLEGRREDVLQTQGLDVLDRSIRSAASRKAAQAAASPVSRRWGIVTDLVPHDFLKALRAARVGA